MWHSEWLILKQWRGTKYLPSVIKGYSNYPTLEEKGTGGSLQHF